MSRKQLTGCVLTVLWIVVAGPEACGPVPPTGPLEELVAARGGGGGGKPVDEVAVTSLDPDTVPADTVLTIRVLGSGFTAGSEVSWALAGTPTTSVTTSGPVVFVSSRELHAPVTVQPDALLTSYDIVVTAAGGKKGIGVEKLEVVAKFYPLPEPGWAVRSEAYDVNDGGVVVGSAIDAAGSRHAVRWVPDGTNWSVEDLGAGEAVAINNEGYVARRLLDPVSTRWRSWVQTPSGAEVYVGEVFLSGISESGSLIGAVEIAGRYTYVAWPRISAAAWDSPVHLPGTATHPYAWSSRINGEDAIAGWVNNGTLGADEWPVVWAFEAGGWNGPNLVDTVVRGRARVVNDHGAIAGSSAECFSGCPSRPVFWANVGAPRQLLADPYFGAVQDGGSTANVVDMNNSDQIAGNAVVPLAPRGRKQVLVRHAVVWPAPTSTEYLDLGAAKAGWFSEAGAINDRGLVVGAYWIASGGNQHAVLWRLP